MPISGQSYWDRRWMLSRKKIRLVSVGLLVGVLLQAALPMPWAMAQIVPKMAVLAAPANDPNVPPRLLLPHDRSRFSLNQLYEFDHNPLGKRIPVVVVPGRAEEFQQNSWWKGLNKVSHRNAAFRRQFKLYVFLYNSKEELDVQAEGLVRNLKAQFGQLPDTQPLMLVTYSLGGVISREVLKDSDILHQVDTMIAIAVPFHGSPLFDPDWFSEYLNPPNRSPIRRLWDRAIYRAYMFSKSNLTRGLRWDNFDSSKPQFDLDNQPAGNSKLVGDQINSTVSPYTEYANADEIRAKTIVYASFLVNGYTQTNQPYNNRLRLPKYVLNNSLSFPKQVVASVLPFYGFTVHSVFTYMNNQLANIPTYTAEDPQGRNDHLYRFNDGAIPVSSMLFLKPRRTPYNEDILGLLDVATVRQARVFANLDHMHLGEYTWRKKTLQKPDMAHPEDGVRSPDEWIVRDLLHRAKEIQCQKPAGPINN